jgi:4-amino-4-deoxy-L-arabinose transferase-like glycosyltransferase
MFDPIRRRLAAHPDWTLALVVVGALMPFLAKPFNIDDPLFIWAAKQIHAHPGNPYGFNVNWGWTEFPMWKVTENPPLACYYVALAAGIFGWSEMALHFAFLLPAIAVILGTHRLAKKFCDQPLLAALVTLFTPVFLVSSTSVMCDVPMLAFWVWAVVFWLEGTEQNDFRKLAAAGLLIALAEMTKYYGACLVPLLAAYSAANRRPVRSWAQCLLIPLAVLCAYQYATQAAYGYSLLFRAMDFASFSNGFFGFSKFSRSLIALTFAGGGMASSVFFMPLLWRRRALGTLIACAVLVAVSLLFNDAFWKNYGAIQGAAQMSAKIQMIFWASGGWCVLALTATDLLCRRDARSLLLALWVMGTFIFAAFCNWTVNARSILPLVPAVAILIVRRLEQNKTTRPNAVKFCLTVSAAFALLVTWSDFSQAVAVRQSTEQVRDKYGRSAGTLWFQGHWGFQFYMEAFGAVTVDFKHLGLKLGEILVVPASNTSTQLPDARNTRLLDVVTVSGPAWLTTWNPAEGAGFYASANGPLPFAFGHVPPETVFVYLLQSAPSTPPKN